MYTSSNLKFIGEDRAAVVRQAMVKILVRGFQPSPGRIQAELGEPVRHGGDLNGRDCKTYAAFMTELGFHLEQPRSAGFGSRWVRNPAIS